MQERQRATRYGPYSNSRLDVGVCGYSFYRQYVDQGGGLFRGQGSLASDRGSAVHEVLEKITKSYQRDQTYAVIREQLREWVAEAVQKNPLAYDQIDDVYAMCNAYLMNPPPLNSGAMTEEKLALKRRPGGGYMPCEYDDPDALVRGKIDILDTTDDASLWTVYDHKTQPNIVAANTLQMGIYAWLVKTQWPTIQNVNTILHFVRYDKYSAPYSWTDEDLKMVIDIVETRIAVIENTTEWRAVENDKCQYCPVMFECPIVASKIQREPNGRWTVDPSCFEPLGNTAKAAEMAQLSSMLKMLSLELDEKLRNFCKKTGGKVAGGNKIYGHELVKSNDWGAINKDPKKKKELWNILEAAGLEPLDFMGPSQDLTKKVFWINNDQLQKKLAQVIPVKISTQFKGEKQ